MLLRLLLPWLLLLLFVLLSLFAVANATT